jgi:hypothetical protein
MVSLSPCSSSPSSEDPAAWLQLSLLTTEPVGEGERSTGSEAYLELVRAGTFSGCSAGQVVVPQ